MPTESVLFEFYQQKSPVLKYLATQMIVIYIRLGAPLGSAKLASWFKLAHLKNDFSLASTIFPLEAD